MSRNVLVVDDEPSVAKAVELLLNNYGIPAIAITEPREVETAVLKHLPAAIFLDYRMKPLTGKDILVRLRKIGVDCPIVILTAYATTSARFEFKALGANEIMSKPFSKEEFEKALKKIGLV